MITTTNHGSSSRAPRAASARSSPADMPSNGHSVVLVARRLDRLQVLADALRGQYRIDIVVWSRSISRMLRRSSNCIGASASKALRSTS